MLETLMFKDARPGLGISMQLRAESSGGFRYRYTTGVEALNQSWDYQV